VTARNFYRAVILLPLVGLGVVAAVHQVRGDAELAAGLGPGGTARWLYPESAVRGFIAYAIVVLWLMRELGRRRPGAFEPLLWWAPLAYAVANVAILMPFVLMQGRAAEFFAEEGGRAGLRLAVHLLIGFSYVGLARFARDQLRSGGVLEN
jgi:hypothetical protein